MDLLSLPIPFGRGNPPYLPFVCCDRLAPLPCCPPSPLARFCALFPPQNALLSNLRTVIASLSLSLYPSLLLSITLSHSLSLALSLSFSRSLSLLYT